MRGPVPSAPATAAPAGVRWLRHQPMTTSPGPRTERWERIASGGSDAAEVEVTCGKHLDVLGLRPIDADEAREYVAELAVAAAALRDGPTVTRETCPCCDAPVAADDAPVTILGITYVRCPGCGHAFVRTAPAPASLAGRFAEDDALAGVYTDLRALEIRMSQIVRPKLEWVRSAAARFGRGTGSLVDVGAGAGHFVAAARAAGIEATGYEISRASCGFAREVMGVELVHGDVTAMEPPAVPADVVTLWGVLEYVADPRRFVDHAARFLADDGLLVVEVPRADALSSAVQRALPEVVWRHMEPTSHLNVFSDASLATLLWDAGFEPVAAWYFGMDVYELLCQLAVRLPGGALDAVAPALLAMQPALDEARICDDVIVAARRR